MRLSNMRMLVCDLDGTLLGDDESLKLFAQWWKMNRIDFHLVYATGRSVESPNLITVKSVRDLVRTTRLPKPSIIIAEAGTVIWLNYLNVKHDKWPPCPSDWDREKIYSTLLEFTELIIQPEEFQSKYKLSYYGLRLTDHQLREIEWHIIDSGFKANVIYSSSRYLDILPIEINKGEAVEFIVSELDIPPDHVFVAGDSGNDLSMFFRGYNGIVVGNAQPELKDRVMLNTKYSSLNHAAGVLDGLNYWMNRNQK